MKFILAPDKFKGSLTGIEFCNTVEQGLTSVIPNAEVVKMPLADGGDGTIDILAYHLKGEHIKVEVHDPLFRKITASYLYIDDSKTAFIEMAKASGLNLLNQQEQNCFYTTSLGTGEMILDAIQEGSKSIILGIGGSATNDGGIGMAMALGYKFLDSNQNEISPIGGNLSKIISIDSSNVNPDIKNIDFKIACDVTNPLFGKYGAAHIYAPQKGASKNEIELLDQGLVHLSKLFLKEFNVAVQNIPGAGAAGGLGAGAIVFLKANLISGIDLVKSLINFDSKIVGADWIITGEGKLDTQTFSGKTIKGVIASAKNQQIPVAAFCGSIQLTSHEIEHLGIHYSNSVMTKAIDLNDAMGKSGSYLKILSQEFAQKLV